MSMEATQLLSDPYCEDYALVIAIDFGTALSGYAYSFASQKNKIELNPNWGKEQGFESYKTRTCVLLTREGKFDLFGYEAESKYLNLDEHEQKKYELYDRFKMALHKEQLWKEETKVYSRTGKPANALDIFSMSLEYFTKHMLTTISEQLLSSDERKVRWVITVPAIWSVGAKQFMRKAAYKAGLIGRIDSKRLVIALEPEAASLYCRNLAVHRFTIKTRGNTMDKGTDYLLLDCGGGTIDITAHKVINEGLVKEIYAASGGPWGGVTVDDNFEKLLKSIFGADFIDKYKEESPGNWLSLMKKFEILKRSVKDENPELSIELDMEFSSSFQDMKGKSVIKQLQETKVENVSYSKGKQVMKGATVESLFTPVIDKMVNHVKEIMTKPALKNVRYMFLVGGFSESKLLQRAFRKEFGGKVGILIPERASVAVMEGAVMFGHNPYAVTHRIARRTYGFKINQVFKPSKHDESRKFTSDGTAYCKGCFEVMVKKNEILALGEQRTCDTFPIRADQTLISYPILQIDKTEVKYFDDDGVDEIGKLVVTSNDTSKGTNRKMLVNFCFGDTELYVNVADTSVEDGKGDVQEAKLNLVADNVDKD